MIKLWLETLPHFFPAWEAMFIGDDGDHVEVIIIGL
jgi:hypothetical protein